MAYLPKSESSDNADSFEPKSSFITAASYDAPNLKMTITFKTGSQYTYLYVRPATWLAFQQSPDHSSYYANAIKGKLSSIPVVKRVVGEQTSTPLHKHTQKRSLDKPNGHTERTGIKAITRRAGLIPESLHR